MHGNENKQQAIIKLLMEGPKHITEIGRVIGNKASAYTATSKLRKEGLIEPGANKGMHQLTTAARTQLGGAVSTLPALPAPQIKHGPAGRAVRGSGNILLRTLLADGAKQPIELRRHMAENGMSPKSISGVIDRAKKGGFIRKNGAGYELTTKGHKIEMRAEAASG
ncbi:helix-turn-helix domain-containing protein [Bradyrhizobium elkanii]|uniref:helix-turn-helix domain-containing protein n=1 Tax=Bradyrhizobium elkanii TaxID=29448 RepID=UPI0004AFDD97|nr:helix-turn-helix domain-containing protein [Bradyrhizobium elkanii]